MRIGVISDIHGNLSAMETVLAFLHRHAVDRIVCLGDAIDPLPGSRAVIERLESLDVPILRGNHEDYVITAVESKDDPIAISPNWEPVRVLARSLERSFIDKLKNMPLTLTLDAGKKSEIVFCHASATSNLSGWRHAIDEKLAEDLAAHPACTWVCGHWHLPETREWQAKRLITSGSIGIPLRGQVAAEFAVLEREGDEWLSEHFELPYDNIPTLEDYRSTGWVSEGGPLAWMLYDEVRTARRRVIPFHKWMKSSGIEQPTMTDLRDAGRGFLLEVGSWDAVAPWT